MVPVDPKSVAEVMGGEKVLGCVINSIADMEQLLIAGLPKAALRNVAYRVLPTAKDARTMMYSVIPESTFKRRSRLSLEEGERSERLARAVALAEHVWGEPETAHRWLRSPHALLAGRSPLAAANTDLGARQVEAILLRIDHGIPA